VKFAYASIGDNLSQASGGGFNAQPHGNWTSIKLFLGEGGSGIRGIPEHKLQDRKKHCPAAAAISKTQPPKAVRASRDIVLKAQVNVGGHALLVRPGPGPPDKTPQGIKQSGGHGLVSVPPHERRH
jgi:hypothetical protein